MHASLSTTRAAAARPTVRASAAALRQGAAISLLLGSCLTLFAYLLARFPFDGLYGQDSYAYYHQAAALLGEMKGLPPAPGALFTAGNLYHWPIGYHLLLEAGLLFNPTPAGGRALTVLAALGSVALLYLVAGRLFGGLGERARIIAGLAAGCGLFLSATFTRMGLSLMSDVPALFWSLLAVYSFLRAYPAVGESTSARHAAAWQLAAGVALGLATLTRYGAGLLVVPLLLYLLAWQHRPGAVRGRRAVPFLFAAGFATALLPQAVYLLTHPSGAAAYGGWLSGWSPGNIFATSVGGVDGTRTFAHSMIVYYLVDPLRDPAAGFLSLFYLPALLLGAGRLAAARAWPQAVLLGTWWLVPALFYSGTTYQADRFALAYLPALLLLFGLGVATAFELAVRAGTGSWRRSVIASALLIIACTVVGAWLGFTEDRSWMAVQHSFKVEEQGVLNFARQGAQSGQGQPRVVSFGMTAALYHYTGWRVVELYNEDVPGIEQFLAAPGPRLAVVPEESLKTQWAGTPLSDRWKWLQDHYALRLQGTAGAYSVYRVDNRP